MKDLVLFAANWPFGGHTEEAFILPELTLLATQFRRVIIVPTKLLQTDPFASFPQEDGNFVLDRTYASVYFSGQSLARECRHPLRLARKVLRSPSLFFSPLLRFLAGKCTKALLLESLRQAVSLEDFRHWFGAFRGRLGLDAATLYYTFWLEREAVFLGHCRRLGDIEGAQAVSRAHRFDIFSIPMTSVRCMGLSSLSAIYPCSDDGASFLRGALPRMRTRISTSYLGVGKLYEGLNPVADGQREWVFFSCHNLIPRKRGSLCAACLRKLAEALPEERFRWILVGDGPESTAVRETLTGASANLILDWRGRMANADVHSIYRREHIDFSVLLSISEGLPVVVLEALAYGIPALATDVGGTREAFDGGGGILLPADVTPELFCERVLPLLRNKQALGAMRQKAYETYRRKFVSDVCRERFVEALRVLN